VVACRLGAAPIRSRAAAEDVTPLAAAAAKAAPAE